MYYNNSFGSFYIANLHFVTIYIYLYLKNILPHQTIE